MKRCIILTGIKHAGKTSAARALAQQLNAPFFDIDELIEMFAKTSCRELYATQGLSAFQKEELKACRFFCAQIKKCNATAIAATGGGICDNKKAFELLHKAGFFIYLRAAEKILFERIISEGKKTGSYPAYIGDFHCMYTRRDNLYKQNADSIIDVSKLNKTKVCLAVYEAAQALLLGDPQTKT